MKRYKVIAHRHVPTRLPVCWTVLAYLVLDRFHAAGWVWASAAVLIILHWAISIILMKVETPVDLAELRDSR